MGHYDLAGEIVDVALVGSTERVAWTREASGLTVTLPATAPSDYAVTLRIATRP